MKELIGKIKQSFKPYFNEVTVNEVDIFDKRKIANDFFQRE